MSLQFSLLGSEDGRIITAYVDGQLYAAHSTHPNFDAIVEGALNGDESIIELFDVAQTAINKFERLTERVTTAHGKLYFDGEEITGGLAAQVIRFLEAGVDDWKPLVRFLDNVQQNQNEHSRDELFDWLEKNEFAIDDAGMIVAYKGVTNDRLSRFGGKAMVNGVVHEGQIPNPDGAVIEMPRSEVVHDPGRACHVGLHVANRAFANSFAPRLIEVRVNPRDVVSVPDRAEKMRVCRYIVIADAGESTNYSPLAETPYEWQDGFEWGDEVFDDDCDCDMMGCDCEDAPEPAPQTPREFFAHFHTNVDAAWRDWNSDPNRTPMTRDAFREAAKS